MTDGGSPSEDPIIVDGCPRPFEETESNQGGREISGGRGGTGIFLDGMTVLRMSGVTPVTR